MRSSKKEVVFFSLWEDAGVLQGELKIEQMVDKWKKCCNSGKVCYGCTVVIVMLGMHPLTSMPNLLYVVLPISVMHMVH